MMMPLVIRADERCMIMTLNCEVAMKYETFMERNTKETPTVKLSPFDSMWTKKDLHERMYNLL